MKKGRGAAASTLSALCTATKKNAVLVALFQDSTSIGARVTTVERHALKRQVNESISLSFFFVGDIVVCLYFARHVFLHRMPSKSHHQQNLKW